MEKNRILSALTWVFFGVTALDLMAVGMKIGWLELASKPLIVISLMMLYGFASKRRNPLYLAALFFSLLGDLFLLDKQGMFLYGVGAFLITQLLYIILVRGSMGKASLSSALKSAVPFAIYLILLMGLLAPQLGSLLVPVFVYGLVISVFGMSCLQNHLLRRDGSSRILLLGAVLFIGSDSMIAINKFQEPHMIYPVAIMLTYALAQYLILNYVLMVESDE